MKLICHTIAIAIQYSIILCTVQYFDLLELKKSLTFLTNLESVTARFLTFTLERKLTARFESEVHTLAHSHHVWLLQSGDPVFQPAIM